MANEINGVRHAGVMPPQAEPAKPASTQPKPEVQGGPAQAQDRVTLTNAAKLLHKLEATVANAPAVDRARVDLVKQQIASGAYKVDAGKVAHQLARLETMPPDARGRGIEHDVDFTRNEDGYTLTMTATGGRGLRTQTKTVTVSYDPQTQTANREITLTGARGEERTRSGEITRTENGYVKEMSVTNRDGETVTRTVEQQYDAESGVVTREINLESRRGEMTRTVELSRDADGNIVRDVKVEFAGGEITPNGGPDSEPAATDEVDVTSTTDGLDVEPHDPV